MIASFTVLIVILLSQMGDLELLFNGGFFTEGPAVALDGTVFFSDLTFTADTHMQAGVIWRFDPATGRTTLYRSPSGMSNGMKVDAQGRLVIAEGADYGGRQIVRTDLATGRSVIVAGLYIGAPFNSPNDLVIDDKGRIFFTDPRYAGHEPIEQPVKGVYRIDTNGTVTLIIGDISSPNGIALSPDEATLYVGCNDEGSTGNSPRPRRMSLLAYDLAPNGTAKFRKKLMDYGDRGGPDGMAVDVEGNIYVAVRDEARPGIEVYSPTGEVVHFIPTRQIPSNVAFGRGAEAKTLYITAGGRLYRTHVDNNGFHAETP